MRVVIAAIYTALLALAGCATTPLSSSEATPIAPSKHLAYKQPGANTAPVLVIRDGGFNTSGCDSKLTVDGRLAAYIGSGEKVLLHIPAGEVIIGAEGSWCPGGLAERQAVLTPGKPAYFRIGYDSSGSLGLHRTIAR